MTLSDRTQPIAKAQSREVPRTATFLGLQPGASRLVDLLLAVSVSLPLILYAYLGTFVRYRGDDYCATTQLWGAENFWQASVTRYMNWSGGYSNLLFIQAGEWFGLWGLIFMAAFVLILWTAGLSWLLTEIARASRLRWSVGLSIGLAALVIFLSLYRTPRLYQVLYWRSSLVGYAAPLALLPYLGAFILSRLRRPLSRSQNLWSILLIFAGAFVIGGTSETIDALQIGLVLLALAGIYLWRGSIRQAEWQLLGAALVGAVLSMVVMALAPGNLVRMRVSGLPAPNLFALGVETLTYVFQFIFDTFKVSPLPALVSFALPFVLFYGLQKPSPPSPHAAQRVKWMMVLLVLGLVVATAFSFAPHAYARSYPSAHVRFSALFLLTLVLAAEGALSGYLLSQTRHMSAAAVRGLLLVSLLLLLLYPIRAAVNLYRDVPQYRSEAAAWDERDAYIRQEAARGVRDLVVVQLDTVGGLQEYKGDPSFYVNRCAAEYYGLDSLIAP